MALKTSNDWHGCPIRFGSVILGDPWSMLILRDIIFKGRKYYADFLNAGEGISTNILANRLSSLRAEGILNRKKEPQSGIRVVYSLTDKGLDLIPAMLAIMDWSEKWDDQTEVPADFATKLRHDRDGLIQEVKESLANQ